MNQAQDASIMSKLVSYKEKLEMETINGQIDGYSITLAGEDLRRYLPDLTDEEINDYVIINDKLTYVGESELIKENAKKMGIDVKNADEVEIIFVSDWVKEFSENENQDETKYLGTKLLDKNQSNSITWKLVIDYANSNQEIARYGTGWYLLEAGTTLSNGKVTTSNFVIDYKNSVVKSLYNYEVWDINSTLAVTDEMVLNVDPLNLKSGIWIKDSPEVGYDGLYIGDSYQNIMRGGDTYYDDSTKSLIFDGDGDFLLNGAPGDLCNGFTFEFFAKSDGARKTIKGAYPYMGIFTKCSNPLTDTNTAKGIRFGLYPDGSIADFSDYGKINISLNNKLVSTDAGNMVFREWIDKMYFLDGEECYLTVSCVKCSECELYDSFGNEHKDDFVIMFYINGELYDAVIYPKASWETGVNFWNNDSARFWIGVTQWNANLSSVPFFKR